VIYPVATSAAVATAVALIAAAVGSVRKPFCDTTGPENVVLAMIISPYKVKAYPSCMRLLGQSDKLVLPR
jgi:hypothetical protein